MEGGKVTKCKMRRGPVLFCFFVLFFFVFVFVFCFFVFASHFSKPLKFVFGQPKWKFSTGKKYFTLGKKIRKNDFAPLENLSCYDVVTQ